jgi:acetylglutamate kinase
MRPLYLLYLDRYHLGDPLFVKNLAKHIQQGPMRECLIVHGSGEKVERTFEAQGLFPERTRGVLNVETAEQKRLVERAVREANHEIVGSLTDEVISTVGIQGTDRGLLRLSMDAENKGQGEGAQGDGAPTGPSADLDVLTGKVGWLEALLKQQVIAVVSALAQSESGVHELWTADAATALAEALSGAFDVTAVMLTTGDRPGVTDATGTREEASVEAARSQIAEPEAAKRLMDAGISVIVTSPKGLWSDPITATRLHA